MNDSYSKILHLCDNLNLYRYITICKVKYYDCVFPLKIKTDYLEDLREKNDSRNEKKVTL